MANRMETLKTTNWSGVDRHSTKNVHIVGGFCIRREEQAFYWNVQIFRGNLPETSRNGAKR